MSKNELNVIARIVLIGVGLYVVLQTFLNILSGLASMPLVKSSRADMPVIIIMFGMYVVITLAAVYFLFRCANFFSAKIVEYESVDDAQISWLAVAFRLICVSAGVFFLYGSIPNLVASLGMRINDKSGQLTYMYSMPSIIKDIVLLVLGLYFAWGALVSFAGR